MSKYIFTQRKTGELFETSMPADPEIYQLIESGNAAVLAACSWLSAAR